MEDVKWIVEDYDNDSSVNKLVEAIYKNGMQCKVIKYVPFQSGQYDLYDNDNCVVFCGSLNLGRQIQREKMWVPGVYCNFKNLCCLTYYSHWGQYLFNDDYIMLPIMEVLRRRNEIYRKFGVDNCIFMRPDSGAKTFRGGIFLYEELEQEFHLMETNAGKPIDEIMAVISTPKPITREWRVVVSSRNGAISASQYKKNGVLSEEAGCPEEVWSLACRISKDPWQPDPLYIIDICECWGKFYFLEANSFSCSGYYHCDPNRIVMEASYIAKQEWCEYQKV